MQESVLWECSQAAAAGKKLYAQNCAQCHGNNLQGMGPAPTLLSPSVKNAKPGELFWFITDGDLNKGMPGGRNCPSSSAGRSSPFWN